MTIREFITWMKSSTTGEQLKKTFDKVTIEKIVKGAIWAGLNTFILAVLVSLGSIDISDPELAGFMAWFIPTAINAWKEFYKGV